MLRRPLRPPSVLAPVVALAVGGLLALPVARAWSPLAVSQDPLVRMPGTQPGQVTLEGPDRCQNCHAGYNPSVEPGHNWQGSMMAQAARDPLFWACMAVAAQDSIWAAGRPNATDICLRCHFPKGWLEGRSDPTNATAMTGSDFDGVQCDFCHTMYDPFFETTHAGTREGSDWPGWWDETNASSTPSAPAADETWAADRGESAGVMRFDGQPFYQDWLPFSTAYTENGSGQYYVAAGSDKRASFADAQARHRMLYSRYHKSKYFCATCHDVSNPVLKNLGDDTPPLGTEEDSAASYYHVERTFSEFMLSAYGQPGGAPGLGPFAPSGFDTSLPSNWIGRCQDCHLRDVEGAGCNKRGAPVRPTDSVEHPNSGLPLHDMVGGNAWVSRILASAVAGSPNYDATNDSLLNQGPAVLTLDLTQGLGVNAQALLDGAARAVEQLEDAASIENVSLSGQSLSFRVQNQTGHKLISGFPEGRRMFVNVQAYDAAGNVIHEINPYDHAAGTLKGLGHSYHPPQAGQPVVPDPQPLAASEVHDDALVYEMKPSSSLTGESHSFHFALADDRYKDNRIPPKGFDNAAMTSRLVQPRAGGADAPNLYTQDEYDGGYDEVSLALPVTPAGVRVKLYYQTTSREYVEFLRDEINGANPTLGSPTPSGEQQAYVVQTDPWFAQLRAWGDTIWQLWHHNREAAGGAPIAMADGEAGTVPAPPCEAPVPVLLEAVPGRRLVTLTWSDEHSADPEVTGYRIYYEQGGHTQHVDEVGLTTTYTDRGLNGGQQYCYVVTSLHGESCESGISNVLCATPDGGGGGGRNN